MGWKFNVGQIVECIDEHAYAGQLAEVTWREGHLDYDMYGLRLESGLTTQSAEKYIRRYVEPIPIEEWLK